MAIVSEEMQADPATAVYQCTNCGFVYIPSRGDPDGGAAPGTPFEHLPADWQCPMCGAAKADFRKMTAGESFEEDAA